LISLFRDQTDQNQKQPVQTQQTYENSISQEQVVSEIVSLLQSLGLVQYIENFEGYMVKTLDDIRSLQEEDWMNLKIPPFHKRKILESAQSLQQPTPPKIGPNTLPPKSITTPSHPQVQSSSREDRRRETPTARLQPGKRFLDFVPHSPTDKTHIFESLLTWANSKKLDTLIINDAIAKVNDHKDEGHTEEIAMSLSLCWLYTSESWVYREMNIALRNDAPSIEYLAPYMNGLLKSNQYLIDPKYFFAGIVYRRTRFFKDSDLTHYIPNTTFIWSAFTSTTIEFDPIGKFGDILFVIKIPEKWRKYALNVQSVSDFSEEQEILLPPNICYTVTEIHHDPKEYPNSNVVIHITATYICIT